MFLSASKKYLAEFYMSMKILPVTNLYTSTSSFKSCREKSTVRLKQSQSVTVSSDNYRANFLPSFTSLKFKEGENNYCDTSFFRDYETLEAAAKILKRNFPHGTDILDFASSNGEEAVSLYAILNSGQKGKYKILCFDKSQNIIDIANKGVYTVYNGVSEDGFLLMDELKDKRNRKLKAYFDKMMEEVPAPSHKINDEHFMNFISQMFEYEFKIKHYKIRDEYKDNFKFNVGDINDIEKLYPEKQAGAILFRNAFYIPTHNLALNEYNMNVRDDINKQEVVDKIIDKVYEKLLPGGLFIMGDNEKDHVFLADENLTEAETLFIPLYCASIYICPPVYRALARDKRFKTVYGKTIDCAMGKTGIFTVWQKNK